MSKQPFCLRRTLGALVALALAGCAMPVENEPVYASQRFLCADELSDELRDEIEDCRDAFERDGSCAGIMSFTGQLEGEAITVESVLESSEFLDLRAEGEGSELRQELKLSGSSPYFSFILSWLDIGGALDGDGDDRTLQYGARGSGMTTLEDDFVRAALRMTVGGESRAFTPREGEITSQLQRLDEHAAVFSADFGASGDYLDGCFHAFPTAHKFTTEVTSDAR